MLALGRRSILSIARAGTQTSSMCAIPGGPRIAEKLSGRKFETLTFAKVAFGEAETNARQRTAGRITW